MKQQPFKRKYRSAKRSAKDVARDEAIRRHVQAEFPPLEAGPVSAVLSDPLKRAIAQSEKSVQKLAHEASVSPVVLAQFLEGERDLRLSTAERLAQVLGLKLVSS